MNSSANSLMWQLFLIVSMIAATIGGPLDQMETLAIPNSKIPKQESKLHHVEPHMIINPQDSDHWLVAAMVVDDPVKWKIHSAVWVTRDGGKTWIRTDFPDAFADPYCSIDRSGTIYFSALGQSQLGDRNEYYYISKDGGTTWSEGYPVQGGHDHPFLKNYGDVTVWWSTTRANKELNIRKAENGLPFSNVKTIRFNNDLRHDNMMHAVTSDGTWLLPYQEYHSDRRGIDSKGTYLYKTSDFEEFQGPFKITDRKSSGKGLGSLLADTTGSSHHGNLYYLFAAGELKQSEGIGISISTDEGKTWRDSKVARNDNGREIYYTPTGAVNKDGIIGVYWYKNTTLGGKNRNEIYFAYSKDGGATFSGPIRITRVSSNLGISSNQRIVRVFPGGGHYSGISTLPDGSFLLVWSDSRSGAYQLYTSKIQL